MAALVRLHQVQVEFPGQRFLPEPIFPYHLAAWLVRYGHCRQVWLPLRWWHWRRFWRGRFLGCWRGRLFRGSRLFHCGFSEILGRSFHRQFGFCISASTTTVAANSIRYRRTVKAGRHKVRGKGEEEQQGSQHGCKTEDRIGTRHGRFLADHLGSQCEVAGGASLGKLAENAAGLAQVFQNGSKLRVRLEARFKARYFGRFELSIQISGKFFYIAEGRSWVMCGGSLLPDERRRVKVPRSLAGIRVDAGGRAPGGS